MIWNHNDFKQTRLGRQLLEEGYEEGLEKGYEEGRKKAREKARQEGRLEVKLEVVPALIERGFSVAEISGILQLDEEKIRQAARKSEPN